MIAKKQKTKGQDPIMLRIRSADLSPKESWSPERTPGCLCQWLCHFDFAMTTIVAHLAVKKTD
jgi:hypothetical protein